MWMLYDSTEKSENSNRGLISKIRIFDNAKHSAPTTAQSTFFQIDTVEDIDQDLCKAA